MLLYFSATGNGKYLADRLCEREHTRLYARGRIFFFG